LVLIWASVGIVSVVLAGYVALGHLTGIPSPELNLLRSSLLAAGLVAAGLMYRRLALNTGHLNALCLFGAMVALPTAAVYAQWLYRHCPAGFGDSIGTFLWPAAVPLATRLGLLPLQLVVCAVVALVAVAVARIVVQALKELCRLGQDATNDAN